ncbi:MAG: hypothetical protein V5A52_03055 [Halovenus sp.]|uniref:hypothetical protein n=1 Tax=Halovenus amylolytica TaxID=2500550 RepID=UPI000FE39C34
MQRRQLLAAVGATAIVSLAGCSILGGDDELTLDSPVEAVEAWHEAITEQDLDAVDTILHSQSPIRPVEEPQETEGNISVDSVDVDVVEESLDQSGVETELSGIDVDSDTISTFAEAENAVVEGQITLSLGEESQEQQVRHFLAIEDGDWRLVV